MLSFLHASMGTFSTRTNYITYIILTQFSSVLWYGIKVNAQVSTNLATVSLHNAFSMVKKTMFMLSPLCAVSQ